MELRRFCGSFSHPKGDTFIRTKTEGVCLYFREGLPIKQRTDLQLVQEMIVAKITLACKKTFFITVYRSPSQTSEQFEEFINKMQIIFDQIRRERCHSLILTSDLDCRSSFSFHLIFHFILIYLCRVKYAVIEADLYTALPKQN